MKTPVGFFFALTFAFSFIFWSLIAATGQIGAGHGLYVTGLQWSPGVAGLVTRYRYRRSLGDPGWKWGPMRFQVLSYLIPIAYTAPLYGACWMTGLGRFYNRTFLLTEKAAFGWSGLPDGVALVFYVLALGTVGMIPSCATALGEEIGLRGFLVPELAKVTDFTRIALISGVGWAVWHYPLFLFADYGAGIPKVFAMASFTITVVALSFLYAWMRLVSGSIWTAMLLHASHNLFIDNIFDPLTIDNETTRFVVGEFGVGLAVAAVIVAVLCCRSTPLVESRTRVCRS
jgi:CAAX protease family protein